MGPLNAQEACLKTRVTACLVIISLLALSTCALAQSNATHPATAGDKVAATDPLFQTISQLDKQLFDAIDRCDMKAEASFWADDAEFYHDKNGLLVGGQQIVDAIKNNLCGKVKRELVPGTLEVYPLQGYGAVEIGIHRFLHPWQQDHGVVGEAKFIHVWRQKDGRWTITRVISIDHHEVR
jgi:ketosteroid isomerase-like protein